VRGFAHRCAPDFDADRCGRFWASSRNTVHLRSKGLKHLRESGKICQQIKKDGFLRLVQENTSSHYQIRPAKRWFPEQRARMDITEFLLSHRERAFLVGDHGSYRTQLSRQIATIRRRLGLATSKNAKYIPKETTAEEIASNVE
jgi:hypothetical protein